MQIDFPKLCTIAYANKIIENCLKAKKGTKPLIFHFDRTTWIDAFAITVIAGTIHCCLKTKKREIREKYGIIHDIEAIKLAIKEGVTSRPQSAGFGLSNIHNFLKVNEGTLTIISGRGKVNFYSNKVESYNLTEKFEGTIVNLKINASKESFYFLTSEEEYLF